MAVESPSTFKQNLATCTNGIVRSIKEIYQYDRVDEAAVDSLVDGVIKSVKDSLREARAERNLRLEICSVIPIDDLRVLDTAAHNNEAISDQSLPAFDTESGSLADVSADFLNVFFTQTPIFEPSDITHPNAISSMDMSSNNSLTEYREAAPDCEDGPFSDDSSSDVMNNDMNAIIPSGTLSTPDTTEILASKKLLQNNRWIGMLAQPDFVTSATNTLFDDFCGAIKYICGNLDLRLPVCGASLVRLTLVKLMKYLDNSAQAGFAGHLRHRVGMYRFNRLYNILQKQFLACRPKLGTKASRTLKGGRASTQALNQLIRSNRLAEDNKSRHKLLNTIAHSRVWAALSENFTSGILCLIPPISISSFERMGAPNVKLLVTILENECDTSTTELAMILSPHFEAILEGKVCLLASWINKGTLTGWSDVIARRPELQSCVHDFEHSPQPS